MFRASVPVSSGGMLSICTDHATGAVYCGGGDGMIQKVGRTERALFVQNYNLFVPPHMASAALFGINIAAARNGPE